MCPPAQHPPWEIGFYWSDEQIISLLANHSRGSHLPDNVLEDSSPYMYPPSNLPEGMWYLVPSSEEKESLYGFWKAKGEAIKVYSNKVLDGWRTTLEYFEGLAPDGQITDWLMQEYMITPKELSDKYRLKDSKLLCRVFFCHDHSSRNEMKPQNYKVILESKNTDPVKSINLDANITSNQDVGHETTEAKKECRIETVPMVSDVKPNSPLEDFSELECFSRGDFLELNDLEDPESHSSSSQNSSCPSNLSEEYFGSTDFLRELEEGIEDSLKQEQLSSYPSKLSEEYSGSTDFLRELEEGIEDSLKQEQLSSSGYRFSTSVVQDEVVLQPGPTGSVRVGTSSTSSDGDNTSKDNEVQGNSMKRHNPESKTEGTSSSDGSPKNGAPSEEKKGSSSRLKKFKTYFCFATF